MKKIFLAVAMMALCGCATPSGKLTRNDFNWTTVESPIGYQESYLRMHRGFNSESAFLTEGNLYSDLGKGMIDVYLSVPPFGRSQHVLARVYITKKTDNTSLVEIGSNNAFPNNPDVRTKWMNFLYNPAQP